MLLHAVATLSLLPCGCSPQQDYQMLATERADELLRLNEVVVDGRVTEAGGRSAPPELSQYIFFWVPQGAKGRADLRAVVTIDSVLKGDVDRAEIELRDYRPPTEAERALLPLRGEMIFGGTRLRLGFDGPAGRRLRNLRLVPLGVTAEVDAALRRPNGSSPP